MLKKKSFFYVLFSFFFSYSICAVTVETFNTGLYYGQVDYATDRKQPIINRLKESDSDIICLQEVWDENDQHEIIHALQKTHPYVIPAQPHQRYQNTKPACYLWDLFGKNKLFSCIQTKCDGKSGSELSGCVSSECQFAIDNLALAKPHCANAIFAQSGKDLIPSIWTVLSPFTYANRFVWNGSSGLLMLSKLPFHQTESISFADNSTITHRETLVGSVNINETDVSIYCTHLTASLANIPYTGTADSWKHENRIQLDHLLTTIKQHNKPSILMGDFNCDLSDNTSHCKQIRDYGFTPVATDCTYCSTNPLTDTTIDETIDYIFVNGLHILKHFRIYDSPIITTQNQSIPYSDHYGVKAILK
ncbi:hypothetical protein DID76_02015 [Candidatus Marinamargulisbacteria bacterium SCGC AG-414-C22]|nr:hypothetical protein DID76_02015 [Candidatus Marinamargulisbacteria bacterium SCGC AG-414-C22]